LWADTDVSERCAVEYDINPDDESSMFHPETSVFVYYTPRFHSPEDHNLNNGFRTYNLGVI
jgi:hypothetical protein